MYCNIIFLISCMSHELDKIAEIRSSPYWTLNIRREINWDFSECGNELYCERRPFCTVLWYFVHIFGSRSCKHSAFFLNIISLVNFIAFKKVKYCMFILINSENWSCGYMCIYLMWIFCVCFSYMTVSTPRHTALPSLHHQTPSTGPKR